MIKRSFIRCVTWVGMIAWVTIALIALVLAFMLITANYCYPPRSGIVTKGNHVNGDPKFRYEEYSGNINKIRR